MAKEISRETQSKLIERLESLAGAFKRGNSKEFGMSPHSCSGTNVNEYPYCFYDSKRNQLFSVVSSHWTCYSQDMAGETESEHGINYYLRVYVGRKLNDEPNFEFSGKKVEKLYLAIEDKLERAEIEREKQKKDRALKKLKQFAGG